MQFLPHVCGDGRLLTQKTAEVGHSGLPSNIADNPDGSKNGQNDTKNGAA